MARTNNLSNFLTDIATAIKTKKGSNTAIPANEFDTEIANLPSQGTYQEKSVTITQNGTQTITPDTGYDAIDELTVNTNIPLQSKTYTFTQNTTTTITPEQGYEGFSQVGLEINVPSGSGDVKLFATEEAMQADPTAQEGDLAVVYGEQTSSVTADSEFSNCTFPKTVVLSEAFEDDVYCGFRAVDETSSYYDAQVELNSTSFRFNGYGDSSSVTIQYTSSDGITYTRTDSEADTIDFGTAIKFEDWGEPFNSVLGNFMKIQDVYFGGVYKYISPSYQIVPSQLDATAEYVYEKIFYGKNGIEVGTLQNNTNLSISDIKEKMIIWDKLNSVSLDTTISDGTGMFEGLSIRTIPLIDTSNITIMANMFCDCTNLETVPQLNTSKVTDMNSMFTNCRNLASIPQLDTSNVTNMQAMVAGTNITTIPLLDTSNVTTMEGMFVLCKNLTSIPQLNTSNVTNMQRTFEGCTSLTTIPLLDASNVTTTRDMFIGCTNLSSIPQLDTGNVTDMYAMFASCRNLASIPQLNTSNVTNMQRTFEGCTSLTTIPLLDTSNVTTMENTFNGCTNLLSIPLLDTNNVTTMYSTFINCTNLETVPQLNTSKVTTMSYMFGGCTSLSDTSLNNILMICINSAVTGKSFKTLKYLSLTAEQANRCKTLSNYSAFTAAGWTTGY